MELPRNITQIGEADEHCKIYVEDYVVSYLKQLNPLARDKTMAAALYGKRKTEEGVNFLFVYGAGKLDFIQKEVKHLSQAQRQEIERIRRQYFGEYEFLGYRILDGSLVEGFHVFDQEVCNYVEGYAQFYEKNESMLSYMLESRQTEATPEQFDSEKYEVARSRQEKRKEKYAHDEEKTAEAGVTKTQKGGIRVAAASLALLLCALGIAVNTDALKNGGFNFEKWKQDFAVNKLSKARTALEQNVRELTVGEWTDGPVENESVESGKTSEPVVIPTAGKVEVVGTQETWRKELITDKETDEAENQTGNNKGNAVDDNTGSGTQNDDGKVKNETENEQVTDVRPADQGSMEQDAEVSGKAVKEPTVYVVCKGDTLSEISLRTYGSERFVSRICDLNGIKNPDEIQEGQKILLP